MNCPSRFEVDEQLAMAVPDGGKTADRPGEQIRLLKFLAYLAIGGS